jgi:protein-tyrosine phosphatase
MPKFTWWIDEPVLKGSANPADEDLAELRVQGFATAVSLLEEDKQPTRYDKASAQAAGWSIDSFPVEEGSAPSFDQIREFTNRLRAMPLGTKVLVFCESGLGRTSFMGAAYWIAKGLSASDAIARMSQACRATDWKTQERQRVLTEYERSMKG